MLLGRAVPKKVIELTYECALRTLRYFFANFAVLDFALSSGVLYGSFGQTSLSHSDLQLAPEEARKLLSFLLNPILFHLG